MVADRITSRVAKRTGEPTSSGLNHPGSPEHFSILGVRAVLAKQIASALDRIVERASPVSNGGTLWHSPRPVDIWLESDHFGELPFGKGPKEG